MAGLEETKLQQRPKFPRSANVSQYGFTLLEVLVALVLLGIGMGMGYTAISGSTRLDGKMTAHTAAVALARAKLDEALANPLFALANEKKEGRYAGIDFGYRAVLSPLAVLEPDKKLLIPGFKSELEQIDIEVFWGPKEAPQSYKLTSYRVAPPAPGTASAAAKATP